MNRFLWAFVALMLVACDDGGIDGSLLDGGADDATPNPFDRDGSSSEDAFTEDAASSEEDAGPTRCNVAAPICPPGFTCVLGTCQDLRSPDTGVVESDASEPEEDARVPEPQRDAEVVERDAAVEPQEPDAFDVKDARVPDPEPDMSVDPPIDDVCQRDRDCDPGNLCLDNVCLPELDDLMTWCWDWDDPATDRHAGTCHNLGDAYWSPMVWLRADFVDGPPRCGSHAGLPVRYPARVECCRASDTWNDEEAGDYRQCYDFAWSYEP